MFEIEALKRLALLQWNYVRRSFVRFLETNEHNFPRQHWVIGAWLPLLNVRSIKNNFLKFNLKEKKKIGKH